MKKYVLLAGDWYYPSAGLGNLIGGFDTVEEAQNKENLKDPHDSGSVFDWAYIVDRDSWKVLYSWETDIYRNSYRNDTKLLTEWKIYNGEK